MCYIIMTAHLFNRFFTFSFFLPIKGVILNLANIWNAKRSSQDRLINFIYVLVQSENLSICPCSEFVIASMWPVEKNKLKL